MYLVCGEALYDVFAEGSVSEREGALQLVAGGSPFNVAIGIARLGGAVALASDLANDVLGHQLAAKLSAEGVADQFLRRSSPTTALALVSINDAGCPSYSFSGLEQAAFCPASDMIGSSAEAITGVHLGSIAAVLPNSATKLLDLAEQYSDRALVSFDPNVRLGVVPDPSVWRSVVEAFGPFCTLIKVSEEDIVALYGNVDPEPICSGWLKGRTALVVLTKGANGAVMFNRSAGRVEVTSADVTLVDTVGAGDSFMAALLVTLAKQRRMSSDSLAALNANQLTSIGSLAALAAAVTCSRRGPMLPTPRDLRALGANWPT